MIIKNRKNYGIIFWITGLSGSGKSTLGSLIFSKIKKTYGNSILIHGDNIRKIYNIKKYDFNSRLKLGKSNFDLCKLISNQGINVIFTTVGLMHKLHEYNRKNSKGNYIEIYIQSNIKKLIHRKSRYFYKKKIKNTIGIDIKPELPKKPHIKIINNFTKSPKFLSEKLFYKINDYLKKN